MATIATAANGVWSATATWTGGVLPGTGDVAQINHQVTLDSNQTIGGVDPTSTGCVQATSQSNRVLVGVGGRPTFVLRALVI